MDIEKVKVEIIKLKQGECYIWPKSDYGLAEIWKINDYYFVFEIPEFGGNPYYSSMFIKDDVEYLIKHILSWT
jgi:hypothetical protein